MFSVVFYPNKWDLKVFRFLRDRIIAEFYPNKWDLKVKGRGFF